MDIEAIAWVFGFVAVAFAVPHWLFPRGKKTAKDAEWERDSGHLDWVVRGGTNEGYLPQNSCYTAGRDRLKNWKPSK